MVTKSLIKPSSKTTKVKDKNILVVDLGTMFIKYSLFTYFSETGIYLTRFELKHASEIYTGELNFNLLRRDLERKVSEINDSVGRIDKLIIIPVKGDSDFKVIPRFEYQEDAKLYTKAIKSEYKDIETPGSVYDWSLTEDNPQDDYQAIILESIKDDLAFKLLNILVDLDVDEYSVASSVLPYSKVPTLGDKARLVIDLGHSRTRLAIVSKGNVYSIRDVQKAGSDITSTLAVDGKVTIEHTKQKHEIDIDLLPNHVNAVIDDIISGIKKQLEEFRARFDIPIDEYVVLGGTANLELEKELNYSTIGLNRVYPELQLVNDMYIPSESRNYLSNSYYAMLQEIETGGSIASNIDFTAPKSGGLGLKVKKVINFYNKNKFGLYSSTALTACLLLAVGFSSQKVDLYYSEVQAEESAIVSEVSDYSGQIQSLNAKLADLNSNDLNSQAKDTGALLNRLNQITPPKFNISEIKLDDLGDTGTIVVKTESQVTVSSFLTLLQDPTSGIFSRANIINIDIVESLGEKIYVTTIYVEGRKL